MERAKNFQKNPLNNFYKKYYMFLSRAHTWA